MLCSCGEREGAMLVLGDLVDHSVELGACEGPFERPGDVAVVLGEVHEMPGEFGQRREIVRGQRFALPAWLEPLSTIADPFD
jgi:hypothetical protein